MHTFFHGWRRNAGVAALVIACALAAGWLRSLSMADDLYLTIGDRRNHLRSAYGQLFWGGWAAERRVGLNRTSERITDIEDDEFSWGRFMYREVPPNTSIHWGVHYSFVVLPLTLLSAYLLLWKPRSGRDLTNTDVRRSSVE